MERKEIELGLVEANLRFTKAHAPATVAFDVEAVAEAKMREAHASSR